LGFPRIFIMSFFLFLWSGLLKHQKSWSPPPPFSLLLSPFFESDLAQNPKTDFRSFFPRLSPPAAGCIFLPRAIHDMTFFFPSFFFFFFPFSFSPLPFVLSNGMEKTVERPPFCLSQLRPPFFSFFFPPPPVSLKKKIASGSPEPGHVGKVHPQPDFTPPLFFFPGLLGVTPLYLVLLFPFPFFREVKTVFGLIFPSAGKSAIPCAGSG